MYRCCTKILVSDSIFHNYICCYINFLLNKEFNGVELITQRVLSSICAELIRVQLWRIERWVLRIKHFYETKAAECWALRIEKWALSIECWVLSSTALWNGKCRNWVMRMQIECWVLSIECWVAFMKYPPDCFMRPLGGATIESN